MKRILLCSLLATSIAFTFNSCKKDPVDTDTTAATDNSICEGEFMRIMPTVNKISITEPGVHRYGSGSSVANTCYTVTVDTANAFPVVMTIDYGTGCVDSADGKTRMGQIICTISEPWQNVGAVATVTFNNFYVGNIHFEGTTTITRTSPTAFTQAVASGKCTTSNWTILYDCNRTFEWTAGASTGTILDDVVQITGNGNGTDRKGSTFTTNITRPIVKNMGCAWIQDGAFDITPNGKATRSVDFGNGTCDNKGTITINGNSFEFTMN